MLHFCSPSADDTLDTLVSRWKSTLVHTVDVMLLDPFVDNVLSDKLIPVFDSTFIE